MIAAATRGEGGNEGGSAQLRVPARNAGQIISN